MKGLVKLAVAAAVAGSAAVGMTAPAWASVSSFETLPGGTLHVVSTSSGITHTNVIKQLPE